MVVMVPLVITLYSGIVVGTVSFNTGICGNGWITIVSIHSITYRVVADSDVWDDRRCGNAEEDESYE